MEKSKVITFSTSEVSKMWGVPRHNITAIVKNGKLKARRIGGRYRINKEDVDAYYNNSIVKPSK